ncbi:MAG: hypothetical protein AAFZ63_08960 [Bacteroidota bacterium]
MEDKSVLDDWREEQSAVNVSQYRRALRFLFYNLGIGVLVAARIGLLVMEYRDHPERAYAWFTRWPDLVVIGTAGIWLFSGLGLLAIFRARHERPTSLTFVLILAVHLIVFVSSSMALYLIFTNPFAAI